jgi:hypothetical protein
MPSLSNRRIDAAEDAESLARLLIEAGHRLPPRLRERILAFGPEVVPPLIALAEDEALAREDAPGEGFAPVHAIELLGELGAAEAVGPMLRVLAEEEPGTYLQEQALAALPKLGAAVIEPALAAHAASTDPMTRLSFRGVLAKLGARDERIYQLLVEALQRDLLDGMTAMQLADYGDPRALPLLSRALDLYEFSTGEDLMANHAVIELEDAIRRLGGELTPEQQEKVHRIIKQDRPQRERFLALLDAAVGRMDLETSSVRGARTLAADTRPERVVGKVGRNAPCPCGSGLKYKKCCLGKEAG